MSSFDDMQYVKVQETPDMMPEGETPVTIHLCAYDELVDYVKPGDKCEFVGIFRAQGIRVNPRQRITKTTFRTFIDLVSITKYNKNRHEEVQQTDHCSRHCTDFHRNVRVPVAEEPAQGSCLQRVHSKARQHPENHHYYR